MSKNRHTYIPVLGSIATIGLVLYIRNLFKIQLTTDEKEAIYNGNIILKPNSKILAITVYPDDLNLYVGGTLKHLSQRNCDITVINVVNDGKCMSLRNLIQNRQTKQVKAANVLGIKDTKLFHLPSMDLKKIENIKPMLENAFLDIKPDIIFAFDFLYPFNALKYPNHINVGRIAHRASSVLKNTKCQFAFYASSRPNSIVDITTTLEDKICAVKCPQRQLRFRESLYKRGIRRLARYSANRTILNYGETFRLNKI